MQEFQRRSKINEKALETPINNQKKDCSIVWDQETAGSNPVTRTKPAGFHTETGGFDTYTILSARQFCLRPRYSYLDVVSFGKELFLCQRSMNAVPFSSVLPLYIPSIYI